MLLRKSFNLIELLIVISVIAILMSLLMPSLKKVQEHGYTISCTKNLKSLSVGLNLYIDDNEHIVTPLCQGRSLNRGNWISKTRHYLGKYQENEGNPFLCPSLEANHSYSNYSMPIYNGCAARGDLRYKQVPLSNISKPDEAMVLADNRTFVHRYDYYKGGYRGPSDYRYRHTGGQNRLFIDGHIQYGLADLELPKNSYWWIWAIGTGN